MGIGLNLTEVFIDGMWSECEFSDLEKGDVFRMTNNERVLVEDANGRTDFTATSDPYENTEGELMIDID